MATTSPVCFVLHILTSPKAPLPMIFRGSKSRHDIFLRLSRLSDEILTFVGSARLLCAECLAWSTLSPTLRGEGVPSWSRACPMLPSFPFRHSSVCCTSPRCRLSRSPHAPSCLSRCVTHPRGVALSFTALRAYRRRDSYHLIQTQGIQNGRTLEYHLKQALIRIALPCLSR